MKTNRSARRLVRVRLALLCLAVLALAALELGTGHLLSARVGQNTAPRTDLPATPEFGMADFMAAAGSVR